MSIPIFKLRSATPPLQKIMSAASADEFRPCWLGVEILLPGDGGWLFVDDQRIKEVAAEIDWSAPMWRLTVHNCTDDYPGHYICTERDGHWGRLAGAYTTQQAALADIANVENLLSRCVGEVWPAFWGTAREKGDFREWLLNADSSL